jgi:glycosyltransferase 2 family protein
MKNKFRTWLLRLFGIALIGGLLWWGLRNVSLTEVLDALRLLKLWEIGVLFVLNIVIFIIITLRWWLIVRAEAPTIPFWPLFFYRLTVFGVSYFSPGPQVGGEPLQVLYLQRNHGLSFPRATSTVIIDKLIEYLTNFVLLIPGLYALIRTGIQVKGETFTTGTLFPLLISAFLPVVYIFLLYRGIFPLGFILPRIFQKMKHRPKWIRLAIVSERLAGQFTRRHPRSLLASSGVSLLFWVPNTAVYVLMLNSLHIHLTAWQVLTALTFSWLAYLSPVTAGLGALEAGQVFALGAMGYSAGVAISLVLLMRVRDIFNGILGLLIGGRDLKTKADQSKPSSEQPEDAIGL